MDNEYSTIVIDHSDEFTSVGFSGDEAPQSMFPSVVGRNTLNVYVGDEAKSKADQGIVSLNYPIQNGIYSNWDDMEEIWNHTFNNSLSVTPSDYAVLITDSPFNSDTNRQKIAEIMFETYNVPALYIASRAILSLYSSGRTTGTIVHSGNNSSYVVSVYEGYSVANSARSLDFNGNSITNYLSSLLNDRGYSIPFDDVKNIKQRLSYVALDYNAELLKPESSIKQNYTLPDGQTVTVGYERFRAVEGFFQPSLMGASGSNLAATTYDSISSCDSTIQKHMFANTVLTGEATLVPGMKDRLEKEMKSLVDPSIKLKVIDFPERQYASWIGGSILSSLSTFQQMWVTREDYDENGYSVGH